MVSWTVIGFDSAWTDNAKAPGAVCAIRCDHHGRLSSSDPQLTSFDQAYDFITTEQLTCDVCVVAIDQPTIVPNLGGMRPVDKVAASLISWLGGGVQPANRSKKGMFDDDAPIWRFKQRLSASDDAEAARSAEQGLFLIEVFPALALPSLEAAYFGPLAAPRYNPGNKAISSARLDRRNDDGGSSCCHAGTEFTRDLGERRQFDFETQKERSRQVRRGDLRAGRNAVAFER